MFISSPRYPRKRAAGRRAPAHRAVRTGDQRRLKEKTVEAEVSGRTNAVGRDQRPGFAPCDRGNNRRHRVVHARRWRLRANRVVGLRTGRRLPAHEGTVGAEGRAAALLDISRRNRRARWRGRRRRGGHGDCHSHEKKQRAITHRPLDHPQRHAFNSSRGTPPNSRLAP